MLPPEAAAPAGGLPKGAGLLMAAEANRPVGGAAPAAGVAFAGGGAAAAPKTLTSGFGTLPKRLPVGAGAWPGAALVWKGLLATAEGATVVAAAKPPPKTEVEALLAVDAVDAVELVAVRGVEDVDPALRLLKAFEKEKVLPGTGVAAAAAVDAGAAAGAVVVTVVVAGTAKGSAGFTPAVVVTGSALMAASVATVVAVETGVMLANNPFEASPVEPPPKEKLLVEDEPLRPPKILAGFWLDSEREKLPFRHQFKVENGITRTHQLPFPWCLVCKCSQS